MCAILFQAIYVDNRHFPHPAEVGPELNCFPKLKYITKDYIELLLNATVNEIILFLNFMF